MATPALVKIETSVSEDTPLLQVQRPWLSRLARRYGNTRKCVSSKAALLILLWSFVVGLLSAILLNPGFCMAILPLMLSLVAYGVISFFFPLAGILADIKFGRYKTVTTSLFIVLLATLLAAGTVPIIFLGVLLDGLFSVAIVGFVLAVAVGILMHVGLIGFTANMVQFGMDQLHDSPAEDSTLFIHWYVWAYYTSAFIMQLAVILLVHFEDDGFFYFGISLLALIPVVVVMVLAITLCFVRRRRRWFLIEPGGINPYKLVYRVTKFARQHNVPVQRSAFTYCEDELPSGLDLGKEKYGGCFTTEQVEDVKAFYGILKVLFSFGIVFLLDFAADSILPLFAGHITAFNFTLYIYIYIFFSTTWFAFPSAEYHMYPSLHLSAASLYLPVCSWDVDENGTWNVFGLALLSGISISG